MKIRHELRLLKSIETQVQDKIRVGLLEGHKKKFVIQEIARDMFATYSPAKGNLPVDSNWIAKHIFLGGFAAAGELNWKIGKAAKQIARGLLLGIRDSGSDFSVGSCLVVRAAVLSALQIGADPSQVTERVISVVLDAGRERDVNLDDLLLKVSRVAAEATRFHPEEDLALMESMILELLDGRELVDEDEPGSELPWFERRSSSRPR